MSGVRSLLAKAPVQKLFIDLSSTSITTSAWAQILAAASNLKACTALTYFYSGSGILKLSSGAFSDEDNHELNKYLFPGGSNSLSPFELASGKRLSAKAVDQNAGSVGVLVINFYG